MSDLLSFDWFILVLRLLLILLLYLFLYQIIRVTTRELTAISEATEVPSVPGYRPAGQLVVVEPADSGLPVGASFPLDPITVIGRHPGADLYVNEPFVSSQHAELAMIDGEWWLRDLGSTNGTLLNDQLVTVPVGVRSGDVVQCGRIKFQFTP